MGGNDEEKQFNVITAEDFPYICRVCLKKGRLVPILGSATVIDNISVHVNWLVKEFGKVQVTHTDYYPKNICTFCLSQFIAIYNFTKRCCLNDITLRTFVNTLAGKLDGKPTSVTNSGQSLDTTAILVNPSLLFEDPNSNAINVSNGTESNTNAHRQAKNDKLHNNDNSQQEINGLLISTPVKKCLVNSKKNLKDTTKVIENIHCIEDSDEDLDQDIIDISQKQADRKQESLNNSKTEENPQGFEEIFITGDPETAAELDENNLENIDAIPKSFFSSKEDFDDNVVFEEIRIIPDDDDYSNECNQNNTNINSNGVLSNTAKTVADTFTFIMNNSDIIGELNEKSCDQNTSSSDEIIIENFVEAERSNDFPQIIEAEMQEETYDLSADIPEEVLNEKKPSKREAISESREECSKKQKPKRPPDYVHRCTGCSEVFASFSEMRAHRREAKHPRVRTKYPCEICGKFLKMSKLKVHLRMHSRGPYKCEQCDLEFALRENLTSHKKLHMRNKQYVCDLCDRSFIQFGSMQAHRKKEHEDISDILPELIDGTFCRFCGNGFKQLSKYQQHMIRRHPEYTVQEEEVNIVSETVDELYEMNCEHSLDSEVKNEAKNEPITISEWNVEATAEEELSIKNDEANYEPSLVTECKDEAIDTQNDEEYACGKCNKRFNTRYKFKMHMATHEKPYECSICGRGFGTAHYVDMHMRTHTGERPHKCSYCGKSFNQRGQLYDHTRIHLQLKPYACTDCEKTFTQRAQLMYHKRVHSGVRPYSCSFCNKSFALKGNLTVHIRTHTGETPYLCEYCGSGFYNSSARNKHQSRCKVYP